MRLLALVMNARLIERIHIMSERAACALFAAATGFAVLRGVGGLLGQVQLDICAASAGMISYLFCSRVLIGLSSDSSDFPIAAFKARELEPSEPDELILTEADMLDAPDPMAGNQETLELDDILAQLGPNSRVVRLFDRSAMPTPGHLKARIDDHLQQGNSNFGGPDASQALSDALDELRRSLR